MNKDVKRPALGGKPPAKIDTKTLKRLLTYMKPYRGTMIVVTICILLSAVAGAVSSMFLQTLIGHRAPVRRRISELHAHAAPP